MEEEIIEIEGYDCQGCIYCQKDGDWWINECAEKHKCVSEFRDDHKFVKFVRKTNQQ